MTTEEKLIKNKLGLLKSAEELGNVSQACRVMGYSRDSFTVFENCIQNMVQKGYAKSVGANPIAKIVLRQKSKKPL